MSSHFILIGLLMVLIVGVQIAVFWSTLKKIKRFKSIFPQVSDFRTVKVYIREDQFHTLTPELILKDPESYSSQPVEEFDFDTIFEQEENQERSV
jgi:hypothetical protein